MPEVDLFTLPNAVIVAWGTQSLRVTGTNGEEHACVTLDLQFQVEPGKVARQSFLMHKDDARRLRADLKNPQPTTPSKEETTQ